MNDILKKRIEKEAEGRPMSGAAFRGGAYFAISHQWISVEEALPELMERVLVAYRLTGRISICIMKRVPHDSSDPDNGKWHWSLVNHKEDVVAWTPLPVFEAE